MIKIKLNLSRARHDALHRLTEGRGAVRVQKADLADLLDDYGRLYGRAEDAGTVLEHAT